MRKILLGITGSVASTLTPALVNRLLTIGEVEVVATDKALYFTRATEINAALWRDEDEWSTYKKRGDKIIHIELRRWASILVIAPLDANTLAKMANGLCDNLLTSVIRAWDWGKPVIVAPAMNTCMWENPLTAEHLAFLRHRLNCIVVDPIAKALACKDIGMGAMAEITTITNKVVETLQWQFPVRACPGIPINHHPGAFGFHRRHNFHTGVDLYCKECEPVFAVESGTVVKTGVFTGPELGHTWWNTTKAVMIEGPTGCVNYGEIKPCNLRVGDKIDKGQLIGHVTPVLLEGKQRTDIPGHSRSMLHLELYKHGTREFADWSHEITRSDGLLDPTPFLLEAKGRPVETLSWVNSENRTVG